MVMNTWEVSISGEDGVELTSDHPEVDAYQDFVTDLERYRAALCRW